jgi:hypothetical protein
VTPFRRHPRRYRRRLAWSLPLAVVLVAAATLSGGGPRPAAVALAAAATDPAIAMDDLGPRLAGTLELRAAVTPAPGRTIAAVSFEYAPSLPADQQTWTSVGTTFVQPGGAYTAAFLTELVPNGYYDVRAVATDDAGATASAILGDRVVANNDALGQEPDRADLQVPDPSCEPGPCDLGQAISGTVDALVTLEPASFDRTSFRDVVVERSPAGRRDWTPLPASRQTSGSPDPVRYAAAFDTTGVPDGLYDLRARATNSVSRQVVLAPPILSRRVDNTPPTVALTSPGASLSGRVALSATASDGGSGVRSVRFERAPAGTDLWVLMSTDRAAPFSRTIDTRQIVNGAYDLRAVAEDAAGNVARSDRLAGVSVENPTSVPRFPALRSSVAPVADVTILGVANGETWGVGTTPAAPAEVGGRRLVYPAQGGQPVLLRRAQDGSWQIVDVPRDADGSPFRFLPPGAFDGFTGISGAMAPSGEAWLWVAQTGSRGAASYGLFHRKPGGPFLLDGAATAALGEGLLGRTGVSLGLTTTRAGALAGVLVSPSQQERVVTAPAPGGGTRSIPARLGFGHLQGGTWELRAAVPPADLDIPEAAGGLALRDAEVDPDGTTWGILSYSGGGNVRRPLFLGRLQGDTWDIGPVGLDALDLPAGFGGRSADAAIVPRLAVGPGSVWLGGLIALGGGLQGDVVARYDIAAGRVTRSWCGEVVLARSADCGDVLDGDVAVPSAVFATPGGEVALAMGEDAVLRYAEDDWERLPAPGYFGEGFFTGPEDGWFAGRFAVGHWSLDQPGRPLVEWPQANRSPLTAIAAPGGDVGTGTSGALAVGLRGTTMLYTAGTGWLPQPLPGRASRINLFGVAFTGPQSAIAVGQAGTIVRWDGSSWTEDPQSRAITQRDLTAVAAGPSGEAWAVGRYGTILHFDGTRWAEEQVPVEDSGRHLTSVTVAGSDVLAVAGGNLITRNADGTWRRFDSTLLPDPLPPSGDLRIVAGLPDGGVVAGGIDLLMVQDGPGQPFRHSAQPVPGVVVAAAATRRPDGAVSPIVSVAPPVPSITGDVAGRDVGGVPPGDGELLRESPSGGWEDMSQAQYPRTQIPADGVVKLDPVLAIAASPRGDRLWAVGGYAGTPSASGQGSDTFLAGRSTGWDTSSIWRFDGDAPVTPPGLREDAAAVADNPAAVTFAYFSAPECRDRCSETLDAQPDVNLRFAAGQIAAFARQPGGPSFAILGGNARGPNPALGLGASYNQGRGSTEFRRLPALLDPLGNVPLFAAFGTRDAVPTSVNPTEAWADAFASAPAPFGRAPAPPGISPVGSGSPTGSVHRFYAFDASRGSGTIRVVVLDNSAGSLEASAPGQTQWMRDRVAEARAAGRPVVVIAYRSLADGAPDAASDGTAVAEYLAAAGVSAVFVAGEGGNLQTPIPVIPAPGAPQIVQFQGARVSYQSSGSFVSWYRVSVDTATGQVAVTAVPLVESLALKPLAGLSVARSQTLEFQAIARRPRGSLATTRGNTGSSFENLLGFDNYVQIPTPSCSTGVTCIQPDYSFTSSDPTIGDFVQPSGPGSRIPRTSSKGRTTASAASGLFCAFNSGTTTVSVTVGLLTASLPVTVRPGGFGRPCGTVARAAVAPQPGLGVPRLPGAPAVAPAVVPRVAIQVPRPRPQPAPTPPPPAPPAPARPAPPPPPPLPAERKPIPAPRAKPKTSPLVVPPVLPAIPTPTPPGGATVPGQSPASAPRREKAHKHASQSAYRIRPAGVRAAEWLAPAVSAAGFLALLLVGAAMRPPRHRPAPASLRIGRSGALVPPRRPRRR